MIEKVVIEDGRGRHVGICTLLESQAGGGELWGWIVSDPTNSVRSETGRSNGRSAAVKDAIVAARQLGVHDAHRRPARRPEFAPAAYETISGKPGQCAPVIELKPRG